MKIKIDFIAGECNGLYNFSIVNNNINVNTNKIVEGKNIFYLNIEPGELIFHFYGKNINRDTLVIDSKMIKDKCIDIQKIVIAGFTLERYHLYHHFFNPYIGKDCTHKIIIPNTNDLLYWYTKVLEKHALLK